MVNSSGPWKRCVSICFSIAPLGGVRPHVASTSISFGMSFLFDEPAGGIAFGFGFEVQRPAVLEGGEPDFHEDFTLGDHWLSG